MKSGDNLPSDGKIPNSTDPELDVLPALVLCVAALSSCGVLEPESSESESGGLAGVSWEQDDAEEPLEVRGLHPVPPCSQPPRFEEEEKVLTPTVVVSSAYMARNCLPRPVSRDSFLAPTHKCNADRLLLQPPFSGPHQEPKPPSRSIRALGHAAVGAPSHQARRRSLPFLSHLFSARTVPPGFTIARNGMRVPDPRSGMRRHQRQHKHKHHR